MSVPVQDPINQIVIAGGEITAPWTWNLQQENELVVQKNIATTGLTVLLILGVDYTVNPAGLGMDGGGTINFEAPQLPAQVGDVWTMSRDTTLNRSDNFATSGDFFAQTINDQLDKLTRIDQDNDRDSESAIRKDPGVGDALNPLIPQMEDRRALLFQDNGGGNFEMIMSDGDPDQQAGDAEASAAAALASEQAAAASETNAANSETAAAQSASDASDSADDAAASAASIDLSSPAPIGDVAPNTVASTEFSGPLGSTTPATVKATTFEGDAGGTTIDEFSTDGTLAGDSDDTVPTEQAVKTYADSLKTEIKIGTFTRGASVASGTQEITGVGFQPDVVIFLMARTAANVEMSIGFSDAVNDFCLQHDQAANPDDFEANTTACINYVNTVGNEYQGTVQSMDSDGFTMDWTRVGAPGGSLTIFYLAIKK